MPFLDLKYHFGFGPPTGLNLDLNLTPPLRSPGLLKGPFIARLSLQLPLHYRLRSIEGGQFRLVNFASHFIRVQIFQIDFPLILYL